MDNPIYLTLTILGALGFFIYGMKVMSEGIQKVAGNRLKDILGAMTSNRVTGVFTGFLTTSLIQSSSATTVMVVSFVNAGLLTLRQSIGVIMGANIGTTMTAWLIALLGFSKFSLSDYALPILAVSVTLLFMRKDKVKSIGEFLTGFALLFIGLDALKGAVEGLDLQNNVEFIEWITRQADQGVGSLLLFIGIGTLLTIIVQSSSAAMALTLTFIGAGLPLELAAAIVLGENIGTTVTANIAALVGNSHAKRAARAHLIFNVFGVLWMILLFTPFLDMITNIFEEMKTTSWGANLFKNGDDQARYSLALFHSVFNIVNTLLLIWFVKFIEKMVFKLVKSKGDDDEFHLEYIGSAALRTPDLSLLEAHKEVAKFGEITSRLNTFVQRLLVEHNPKKRSKLLKKIKKYEEITDRVEVEVANYLSKVSEGTLSEEASIRVRGMLSIVNDLERIGDLFYQMSKSIEKKSEDKIYFIPEQRNNIQLMLKKVEEAFEVMVDNISLESEGVNLELAREKEREINALRDELRTQHLKNVEESKYGIQSGMIYNTLFSTGEKVGDHIINVSEAAYGLV